MTRTVIGKFLKWGKYALILVILALIIYWARFMPVSVVGWKIARGEIIAEVIALWQELALLRG